MTEPAQLRHDMVEHQLRGRGIRDRAVLAAMGAVPREEFVAPALAPHAYDDGPLDIGHDQTISQPYIVAVMAEALGPCPGERVLEIGTGCGYAAAVLARLVEQVYTIERRPELAASAARRLARLGARNVTVRCGDGTLGWPEQAPFDAILVSAAGPHVPPALLEQLEIGGRLVMPVDSPRGQHLVRITRLLDGELRHEELGSVVFVPLIGAQGYPETLERRHASGELARPRSEPG